MKSKYLMSSTGHWKKGEVLSGVNGEGFVEEIELAVALDGIISERRERTPKKDDAFHNLFYSLRCARYWTKCFKHLILTSIL